MDRVADISRFFPLALDVGCGRGHVAKALSDSLVEILFQCDMAEIPLVMLMEVQRDCTLTVLACREQQLVRPQSPHTR